MAGDMTLVQELLEKEQQVKKREREREDVCLSIWIVPLL